MSGIPTFISPDFMSSPPFALQEVLLDHSYLDVTQYVVKRNRRQVGGGGYSDVFRSHLREDCKLGKKVAKQLDEPKGGSTDSSSTPVHVAVKVLRLFGPQAVSPTVEKVHHLLFGIL